MFLGEIKSCNDIRGGEETVQRLKTSDVATYGHKRSGSNMTHCRPAEHIILMPNANIVLKPTVISLPYPFSIWSGKIHDLRNNIPSTFLGVAYSRLFGLCWH